MKILFASNFNYLPQRTGGSESSTNDLCIALLERGVEVAVICSLGMFDAVWIANRIASKLSGYKFVQDRRLPYPVFRGYNVKKGIPEVIKRFPPDIVVVQAGLPFELVNIFSAMKIPVVLYARDIEFQRNTEPLELNRYVGFIANSKFTASRLADLLAIHALVLPPLVDPEIYRVESSRETVVHVGLAQEKGIEISFALAGRRPDIPFRFIESWPVSKNEFIGYQERAKELRNVEILRRSTNMKEFYGRASVLLAPSLCEEAWGRVVTEAQFSGIPVIASDRGGLPESVGAGGLIVPHEANIERWDHALSLLWDKSEVYSSISAAALERSRQEDISKEVVIDKFISYLHSHILSLI
ncbi:MAG: glycosyltransferase family 4 protein [Rhodoferax sp.]|uniref:glycosyltransferase n=1 Tax=Rhodoferax sp. TaxID=50421 RepID=UPI0013FF373E|nr:glycosyltransferase [Rhodoferax sp.]NDP38242.1 glycosyltransferase family 4 protein [Rhodoferax sp.]